MLYARIADTTTRKSYITLKITMLENRNIFFVLKLRI